MPPRRFGRRKVIPEWTILDHPPRALRGAVGSSAEAGPAPIPTSRARAMDNEAGGSDTVTGPADGAAIAPSQNS
jgi:hypothetical protein